MRVSQGSDIYIVSVIFNMHKTNLAKTTSMCGKYLAKGPEKLCLKTELFLSF